MRYTHFFDHFGGQRADLKRPPVGLMQTLAVLVVELPRRPDRHGLQSLQWGE